MKRLLSALLLLTFINVSYSQNWNFINPEEHYHFQYTDDEIPFYTIFIDSSTIAGELETHFLNRLFLPCDTCSEEGYYLDNQPSFLQRTLLYSQVSSTVILKDPSEYKINLPGNAETSWWFDKNKTQEASLDTIIEKDVFGTQDSVAVITIDNSPEIEVSKSFGLIKYFDYELSGLKNANLGMCLPDYKDFYSFQVGDVFQYEGSESGMQFPCKVRSLYKNTVSDIQYNNNSVIIDWSSKSLSWYDPIECGVTDTMLYFYEYDYTQTIDVSDISNMYPNQKKSIFLGEYSLPHFELVDGEILLKYSSSKNEAPYSGIITQNENGQYLQTESSIVAELKYIYRIGLGNVYSHESIRAEYDGTENLIGYVKGSDTTGIVYKDDFYVIDTTTIKINEHSEKLEQVSIYPNPSKGSLTIDLGALNAGMKVKIYSLNGRLLKEWYAKESLSVNLNDLDSGVYIICVKSRNEIHKVKWIKQ